MIMEVIEKIIIALIAIVIGVSLVPIIFTSTTAAQNATTNTTWSTLLGIVPLLFIVGILLIAVELFVTHKRD